MLSLLSWFSQKDNLKNPLIKINTFEKLKLISCFLFCLLMGSTIWWTTIFGIYSYVTPESSKGFKQRLELASPKDARFEEITHSLFSWMDSRTLGGTATHNTHAKPLSVVWTPSSPHICPNSKPSTGCPLPRQQGSSNQPMVPSKAWTVLLSIHFIYTTYWLTSYYSTIR